jgi:hypothetical protein
LISHQAWTFHFLETEQTLCSQTLLNNHTRHISLTILCLEHHPQVE